MPQLKSRCPWHRLFLWDKWREARHSTAMFDLSIADGLARLTLDRPDARNAIPADAWPRLAASAEQAVSVGARLLLLGGRGPSFCAGADLSDFEAMRVDTMARSRFREAMADAFERLIALPIPTIALIHGPCFGAGVALAMACDLRIASPGARFAITPAKIGISYPQADIARLVRLIGPGQASLLLFTAGTIDAAEAARIGLVERVVDDLDGCAGELAEALLANSQVSHAALKRGIALATNGVARDDAQDAVFESLFGSDELAERLARLRGR